MPRLGGAYCFRRVRSQRKSVDWGTMDLRLAGHTSATHTFLVSKYYLLRCGRENYRNLLEKNEVLQDDVENEVNEDMPTICREDRKKNDQN